MIVNFFITIIVSAINIVFSWLPQVSTLPTINGFDLDTALSSGMGYFFTFTNAFWYVSDVFAGFLILMSYYGIKMLLKLIFGHRAPGAHG